MMNRASLKNSLRDNLKDVSDDLIKSLSKCKTYRQNILYIDDCERNLRSFKRASRDIFNLFTCSTTKEARDIIEENKIDLILCDYRFPKTNGLATCDELQCVVHGIPVVMVSGYLDEIQNDPLFEKVKYELIPKPFSLVDVLNTNAYKSINNYNY